MDLLEFVKAVGYSLGDVQEYYKTRDIEAFWRAKMIQCMHEHKIRTCDKFKHKYHKCIDPVDLYKETSKRDTPFDVFIEYNCTECCWCGEEMCSGDKTRVFKPTYQYKAVAQVYSVC